MTISELYSRLPGNYADAKSRLMTDSLIERFILKYLNDDTFSTLQKAWEGRDYESLFRAAHTLKGVAGNLSLTALQQSASNLTEALRNNYVCPDEQLVTQIFAAQEQIIMVIEKYIQDKG